MHIALSRPYHMDESTASDLVLNCLTMAHKMHAMLGFVLGPSFFDVLDVLSSFPSSC